MATAKNDCERNAAKRFIAKLRQDHPHLKFIVTEDSLSSNAPHIETLHDHGLHYILGVKEGDHAYLFQQVQAAEHAGRVTYYERHDRAAGVVHRFRFVNDVPLNASNADVRVNFIEYWEIGDDKVQHFSWVTDLRVSKRNVYHLMRGGRARWKIENETFNTLKNQGYHFEHNYGHGEQHLSVVFAMLMMLAFLVDQTQQLCCALFQAVWAKLGSKRLLWERMRALFYDYALAVHAATVRSPLVRLEEAPTALGGGFLLSASDALVRPSFREPRDIPSSWASYASMTPEICVPHESDHVRSRKAHQKTQLDGRNAQRAVRSRSHGGLSEHKRELLRGHKDWQCIYEMDI